MWDAAGEVAEAHASLPPNASKLPPHPEVDVAAGTGCAFGAGCARVRLKTENGCGEVTGLGAGAGVVGVAKSNRSFMLEL